MKAPLAAALPAAVAAVLLGGCSACVGGGCTTSGPDLAAQVQKRFGQLAQQRGLPPLPPVSCPRSIKNEAGAKTTCYAKGDLGGGHQGILPIHVTVTSVSGSIVNLHFDTGPAQPLGG